MINFSNIYHQGDDVYVFSGYREVMKKGYICYGSGDDFQSSLER
jgi:hypothetical protein